MRKYMIIFCVMILSILLGACGNDSTVKSMADYNDMITDAYSDISRTVIESDSVLTESATEKKTETLTEESKDIQTEPITETQTEKQTEPITETQTEKQTEQITETQAEKKTEIATEVQTEKETESVAETSSIATNVYILNTNTKKFHYPACKSVKQMKDKNKKEYTGTREEVIGMGYEPCGNCHP
ncbi:MAG: hypothetical protein ACI4GD_03535 [Lachnospiraceae bacterium]